MRKQSQEPELGKSIASELSSPALADLAKEIAQTVKDFENKTIDAEKAKIKITAFRSLVQIVAIDWMASNYKNQRRAKILDHKTGHLT